MTDDAAGKDPKAATRDQAGPGKNSPAAATRSASLRKAARMPGAVMPATSSTAGGGNGKTLRADLRDAWDGDEQLPGDPPSDSILNAVIADMRRAAEKCDRDPATPAEAAAELIGDVPWEAFDEHPGRLKVNAGGRNPFDAARDVADYLLKANEPPRLFAMGPAAAVLLRDDGKLDALDQDGWLAYVAERVDFLSRTSDGEQLVAPPAAVMKIVATIILRELPQLDGVTSTPYLDARREPGRPRRLPSWHPARPAHGWAHLPAGQRRAHRGRGGEAAQAAD